MFGDCLGVLDSCAGMDFVEQDYQTFQIPPPEVYAATPGNFGNNTFTTPELNAPSPDAGAFVCQTSIARLILCWPQS